MRTIGLGKVMASTTIAPRPTNHIHGASAAIARPPSSGVTGSRLNRFRKKPVKASACPQVAARGRGDRQARGGADRAEDRAGEADARLGQRVAAQRLRPHERAQEGDEDRRAGLDALAAQRDDVAHLVDEEQHDEPDGEPPAPDQRIGGHRDEHRARGGEHLDLGQQQQDRLELGADHGQRREQATAGAAPPRTPRLAERRGAFGRRVRRRGRQPAGRKLVGALLAHLIPRIGCADAHRRR